MFNIDLKDNSYNMASNKLRMDSDQYNSLNFKCVRNCLYCCENENKLTLSSDKDYRKICFRIRFRSV